MKACASDTKVLVCVNSIFLALSEISMVGEEAPSSPSEGASSKTVVLSSFGVTARPVGSFGFSVQALRDGLTQRVIELTVDHVAPNSEADVKGMAPLTQIVSIDGRDVHEFTASFANGSDLNRKLMDRKPGDRIELGVLVPGARFPKVVTLTEGTPPHLPTRHDSDFDGTAPNAVHVNANRSGSP
jgi:hypothetical protein